MLSLGIDIGTTTITAVAFDTWAQQLLARATLPNDGDCTPPDKKALGWAEIDMQRVFAIVLAVMQQVTQGLGARAADIQRIGVTGQMHGVAFLDDDLAPVRSAITWQDQRASQLIIDFIARAGGVGAFENMGCLPATGYLGPTLFWLMRHHTLLEARVSFIPDAVVAFLLATPRLPLSDTTLAASSGIFDIVNRCWDERMIDRLGLPRERLPAVAESASVIGPIRADLARQCHLPVTAQVCVALGDHQASVIGSLCDAPGDVHINIGTGAQISMIVDRFLPMDAENGIETRPFVNANRYLLSGSSLCGGKSVALLHDFYTSVARDLGANAEDSDAVYDWMMSTAERVPSDADGLRCSTLFDGARHKPDVRGSFTGILRTNFTPAHFTRALLEGVVEELFEFYHFMQLRIGTDFASVNVSGNAIRKNKLLRTIVTERFRKQPALPPWEEEAAVGAAIMAAGQPIIYGLSHRPRHRHDKLQSARD